MPPIKSKWKRKRATPGDSRQGGDCHRIPAGPPAPVSRGPRVFLADEILNIDYLPGHFLVVGGGAVGVEMAAIFRELGSQVTLVEAMDRLLPHEDAEMADYLAGVLKRRKITVKCDLQVREVQEGAGACTVRMADGMDLNPDAILLATGRRFNTEGLGLEHLGVELDQGRDRGE